MTAPEDGGDVIEWLDHAPLVACKGGAGALLEGVTYRKKGSEHSILDRQARIRAADAEYDEREKREAEERM